MPLLSGLHIKVSHCSVLLLSGQAGQVTSWGEGLPHTPRVYKALELRILLPGALRPCNLLSWWDWSSGRYRQDGWPWCGVRSRRNYNSTAKVNLNSQPQWGLINICSYPFYVTDITILLICFNWLIILCDGCQNSSHFPSFNMQLIDVYRLSFLADCMADSVFCWIYCFGFL